MDAAAHAAFAIVYAIATCACSGLVWIACGRLAYAMTGAVVLGAVGGTAVVAHTLSHQVPVRPLRACAAGGMALLLFGLAALGRAFAESDAMEPVSVPVPYSRRRECSESEYEGTALFLRLALMCAMCAWGLFVVAVASLALAEEVRWRRRAVAPTTEMA